MPFATVVSRPLALCVTAAGVVLSIATSPPMGPTLQALEAGPLVTFETPAAEARFSVVVRANTAAFEEPPAHTEVTFAAHGSAAAFEGTGDDADEPLSPEDAVEHERALSLVASLERDDDEPADLDGDGGTPDEDGGVAEEDGGVPDPGEERQAHAVIADERTSLVTSLPLDLVCVEEVCEARYTVALRGPRDVEALGAVAVAWSVSALIAYPDRDENGDVVTLPEGAAVTVEIVPLDEEPASRRP